MTDENRPESGTSPEALLAEVEAFEKRYQAIVRDINRSIVSVSDAIQQDEIPSAHDVENFRKAELSYKQDVEALQKLDAEIDDFIFERGTRGAVNDNANRVRDLVIRVANDLNTRLDIIRAGDLPDITIQNYSDSLDTIDLRITPEMRDLITRATVGDITDAEEATLESINTTLETALRDLKPLEEHVTKLITDVSTNEEWYRLASKLHQRLDDTESAFAIHLGRIEDYNPRLRKIRENFVTLVRYTRDGSTDFLDPVTATDPEERKIAEAKLAVAQRIIAQAAEVHISSGLPREKLLEELSQENYAMRLRIKELEATPPAPPTPTEPEKPIKPQKPLSLREQLKRQAETTGRVEPFLFLQLRRGPRAQLDRELGKINKRLQREMRTEVPQLEQIMRNRYTEFARIAHALPLQRVEDLLGKLFPDGEKNMPDLDQLAGLAYMAVALNWISDVNLSEFPNARTIGGNLKIQLERQPKLSGSSALKTFFQAHELEFRQFFAQRLRVNAEKDRIALQKAAKNKWRR